MRLESRQVSNSFVLSLAIGLIAATGLAGCGGSDSGQDPAGSEIENINIDAQSIASLKAGESYNMDLKSSNVVYRLDYSAGTLDYSRIQIDVQGDENLALTQEMTYVAQGNYGTNTAPKLLAGSDKRFSVASNPAAFGVLSASELDEINKSGYVYHQQSSPSTNPQTTNSCFDVTECCCFNALTGAPWDGTGPEICFDVTVTVCP